jgi:hypothetical protein
MSRQGWSRVAGGLRWLFALTAASGVTSIFLYRSSLRNVIILLCIVFGALILHGVASWWRQKLVAPAGPSTRAAVMWSRGVQAAGFAITLGAVAVNLLAPPDSKFRMPVAFLLGVSVLAESMWPKHRKPRRTQAPAVQPADVTVAQLPDRLAA